MKRISWGALSAAERREILRRPERRAAPAVIGTVRSIFEDMARDGDEALRRWSMMIDRQEPRRFDVSASVVASAKEALAPEDVAAIEEAAAAVRFYHEATKPKPTTVETAIGIVCRRIWRPIDAVGLYVPGGSAPLASTLIMLAEPARAAGVKNVVVATPPGRDGAPHPAIVVAAATCGVDSLWLIGGAQAIAALALGVMAPRVDKIFGPGNAYVAEAKRHAANLAGGPAIDLPAGPSELMVIADRTANPAFIAADLLSQSEHDADAQAILVSTSSSLVDLVTEELARQLDGLPREAIARAALDHARAIEVTNLDEAIAIANAYAPEHLSLQVERPAAALGGVVNAGAIFLGGFSAETLGDYVAGPSHVLPTDGAAAAYGGVCVEAFMKSMTVQEATAEGMANVGGVAARFARLEGLEAHARAVDLRLAAIERGAPEPAPAYRRRRASVTRTTRETAISASVDLDAAGPVRIDTGVGFYDHMLQQTAHHGGFALSLSCAGDLHIDSHHTIEDCALAFGQAFRDALGDRRGIARFGFVLPMDEAEARLSIDLGGRPFLVFDGVFAAPALGAYPTEMTAHVFRSFAEALGASVHLAVTGDNDHHKTEACFKALGRALRQAIRRESDDTPSTKGVL